ncbi:MAG: DUF2817 domain-containing protein [Alphaproteobacteria bacterium]|nr:DUF2817 domain-containing protein [Alphaproteobacteria bacterium]
MTLDARTFFSADYGEARAKFLSAAADRGLEHTAYLNPHAKGPKGEDLTIDVAVLGPADARAGLLVISGTHGVEGYAGSGAQIGWLRSTRNANWPAGVKLVLVHALNPFGFAWNRRVNEENVDLNRNFVDHAAPYPQNKGYDVLKSAIVPPDMKPETLAAADHALRSYGKEHGVFALQEAISQGQYAHLDGMYFGGTREQWSVGTILHIVRREFGRAERVGIVDIHTGLGSYGHGEIITEDEASDPRYARSKRWWGDVRSTQSGESVSAHVLGSIDSGLIAGLPHAEVTAGGLEFGTYPTLEVFQALRADNWLHTLGDPRGPDARGIKAAIRKAFYPDLDDWKEMVWKRSEQVLSQAVEALANG